MIRADCSQCGLQLKPGVVPCKAKSLDVRPDGTVILVLVAACPRCGGPLEVEWHLYCSMKEDANTGEVWTRKLSGVQEEK